MSTTAAKAIVRDDTSFYRDESNRAVINSNTGDYHRRLSIKNANKKKEAELQDLKTEVKELRDLVKQLISLQQTNSK